MNGQDNRVNHENTDSTEKTSHLERKTSKFDTSMSEVLRHVKTCFARVRSRGRCNRRHLFMDFD